MSAASCTASGSAAACSRGAPVAKSQRELLAGISKGAPVAKSQRELLAWRLPAKDSVTGCRLPKCSGWSQLEERSDDTRGCHKQFAWAQNLVQASYVSLSHIHAMAVHTQQIGVPPGHLHVVQTELVLVQLKP